MILSVSDLRVQYGAIQAVRGIDLEVAKGEIVALIGANGAGKTTTAKAIAGLLPFSGTVRLNGAELRPARAEHNVRAGLALVPEGRGILTRMTVDENLKLGVYCRDDARQAALDLAAMYERFPLLAARRFHAAGFMSGGEQQLLAIARALLSRPQLLLLDEPSLGLAPKMTAMVFELIADLRSTGLAVLLIEQKARHTLKIADRAYLIDLGRVVMAGPAAELANDPVVSATFLGGSAHQASTNTLSGQSRLEPDRPRPIAAPGGRLFTP